MNKLQILTNNSKCWHSTSTQ